MECRLCGCVACCIGVYPTSSSSPPALRSGAGSTMASTITTRRGPALLCLCNMDGVPLQKSVIKIGNGFSLYFAILMGVRVHSSCFAYSEASNCSIPGTPKQLEVPLIKQRPFLKKIQ